MLKVDPYPYQNAAIDQALDRGNLLIAYGMGLGKSLIQMGICEELIGDGDVTLNALVVPASLKWQWAQNLVWGTDVTARTIKLKKQKIEVPLRSQCVVIDGTQEKRDELYRYVYSHRPNYVILGYENVVNDWRMVRRMKPDLISLDEATAIKSFGAERSKMVKEWWAPYRYALTGTPIDNRPEELFSIMEWVDPGELGRADLFDKAYIARDGYGRMKRLKNIDVLHAKTKNFMARKTRFDPDVAPYMPKDFHKDFLVTVTGKTRTMYHEINSEMIEALEEIVGTSGFDVSSFYGGDGGSMGSVAQGNAMARYSALAMLVDHPLLLVESARKYEDFVLNGGPLAGSKYAYQLLLDGRLDWISDSKYLTPKFTEVLNEIVDICEDSDKAKVILFSFSKYILRLLNDALKERGVESVIFDGDMSIAQKESAKMSFKRNVNVRVFLSSDAGGMGVDLPEANYLINFNHPWSAGKADQRNSRHIRAGSLWDEVFVLNYVVENSVEQWKYDVLRLKRKIGSAIIDGVPQGNNTITFDVDSLLEFARSHRL